MAIVSVLVQGEPKTFAFEHMCAHRNLFAVMSPLDRFSVLPYLLDPMVNPKPPANGAWMLNHQQAHNDALGSIPQSFGVVDVGLFIGQDLMDTDLSKESSRRWWTFANHMEHYVANQSVLPTPAPVTVPQPPPVPPLILFLEWIFPFW